MDNQFIMTILSVGASAFAAAISYMNYKQSKRTGYSDVITRNRLKWIDDFRDSSVEFLDAYFQESNSQNWINLRKTYFKLMFLINNKVLLSR